MTRDALLDLGRDAVRRHAWGEAFTCLSAADEQSPLEPTDLAVLASAAQLLGRDGESVGLWERAHHGFLGRGEVERAVRCAFWLAFGLFEHGEPARAGGKRILPSLAVGYPSFLSLLLRSGFGVRRRLARGELADPARYAWLRGTPDGGTTAT